MITIQSVSNYTENFELETILTAVHTLVSLVVLGAYSYPKVISQYKLQKILTDKNDKFFWGVSLVVFIMIAGIIYKSEEKKVEEDKSKKDYKSKKDVLPPSVKLLTGVHLLVSSAMVTIYGVLYFSKPKKNILPTTVVQAVKDNQKLLLLWCVSFVICGYMTYRYMYSTEKIDHLPSEEPNDHRPRRPHTSRPHSM